MDGVLKRIITPVQRPNDYSESDVLVYNSHPTITWLWAKKACGNTSLEGQNSWEELAHMGPDQESFNTGVNISLAGATLAYSGQESHFNGVYIYVYPLYACATKACSA
jgi:hypothetical protein